MPTERPAIAPKARSRQAVDWSSNASLEWIVPLAEPYLRGYVPIAEPNGPLAGYRFLAPGSAKPAKLKAGNRPVARGKTARPVMGFFIGYLLQAKGFSFLHGEPPECLVFWFIEPVDGRLHRRLVRDPQGLAHGTAEYIRWLTHRPPRFELFEGERITLVRHDSMRAWPRKKVQHLSRNFFIETLAWLVRSALVRRLPDELASLASPGKLPA